MLETHTVARSLTDAEFTPASADAITNALRLAAVEPAISTHAPFGGLTGRTGTATAVSGGLAVVKYPDGVERLDPAQLAWAGLPMRTTDTDALKEVGPGEVAERVIAVKFEYRLSVDTRENGYSLETLLASGGGAAELRGHRHHVVDGGLELKGLGRRKGQRVGVAGEQPELHGDGLPAASGTVTVDTAAAAAHGRCRQPDRGSLQFSIIAGTDAGAGSTAGWRGRPHGVVARPPRSPDGQSDTVGAGGPFLPEGD